MSDNEFQLPSSIFSETTGEPEEVSQRPPFSATVATREMMLLRQDLAATLLELSQDAIVIRDAEDRVTFWNRGAQEMYGWSADEALSKTINVLLKTDPTAWAALNERLERTDFWDGQLIQKRKSGSTVRAHCREVLVRNAAGKRSAVLAIKRDITEQHQAIEALKEADRRKDEFLATLAHELRNPLAPIRNAVEIMRLAGDDRAAIEHSREVLDRQAGQLARIVEDLIDLARIVEKKVEIRKERVPVRSVIETALETSRPQLEEARLRLDVQLPSKPLFLDADPVRISQVLVNLLNNAAKHTAVDGKVSLIVERTARTPDAEAQAGGASEDARDMVTIRVRDTGIGISPTLLPHVFEMFTQGPRTTQQGRGGLGVGLALVRNLVAMHGGTVQAFSAGPGEGSEFAVHLPLALSPHESPVRPRMAWSRDNVSRKRIIVADDNDDQVESLAMLLRLMGHTVSVASNGPQAIEQAISSTPDLMLVDIGMPGMDGYEVARRIRQHADLRNVLLVAQTGWGSDLDRERSAAAGFDAHLVKPVTPATLEEVLRAVPR
jgi:PAS domain S-box-containing protein